MYCSASPSMYCQRSLAAKTRVSLVLSQPATAPDAGNGSDLAFLHPSDAVMATIAPKKAANTNNHIGNIHPFELNFKACSPSLSVEQNLAAGRTAFANACHVHSGVLLQRAGVLAGAASHAAAGIDARLLERLGVAGRVDHLGLLHIDSLGRDRAPLLADDAINSHRPRQAAAAVVKRRPQADRLVLPANPYHPALFLRRDLPDGASGANLRAHNATRLAIADARHQRRRPQSFQAGLIEGGVQRGVGADLHALAAADAAGEKILLIERAGRAQQAFMAAFAQARVGAHQRNDRQAGGEAGERPAPAQVG